MKKLTLNELMGKSGEQATKKLGLSDLGELLGERLPKFDYTRVGRLRLTNALRARFGDNYMNLPGMDDILREFDDEARFKLKLQEMKQIRARKK